MRHTGEKHTGHLLLAGAMLLVLAYACPALAQVEWQGGTDNTQELGTLLDLFKTMQGFVFSVVAKFIGGVCVVFGLTRIAVRAFVPGAIALVGGASLFFAERVADTLSKISGGP